MKQLNSSPFGVRATAVVVTWNVFFGLAWFAGGLSEAAGQDPLPLVYREDFEKGADNWQPTDPQGWQIVKTDAGQVYSQFTKRSNYEPPYRSPYNLSLLKEHEVGDFVLTARVRSTHPDYGHRDACMVFGYQDPAHFYYVHFGKQTDDHANQIFIVDNADRTKISTQTTSGTNWDDDWHQVKIVRRVKQGTIEVFFDDMQRPVMKARDTTFARGRIGLGSFDDTSEWDDVVLRGTPAKKGQE